MEAEQERREMIDELKSAVQGIVDLAIHSRTAGAGGMDPGNASTAASIKEAAAVGESESLTEQNSHVRRLLKSIEDVLHHQIKPPLFGHVPKVWKYLENLDKCLPGTSGTLQSVRQYGDSDYARVRLFIRLALNEHALSEYLSALAWNKSLTTNFYKEEALLRHEESLDTMFLLLENLNNFNFALVLKDKELERPRYWDIVPVHSPPPPPQAEPKREPSVGAAEKSKDDGANVGGLKALTSIVSAVVDVAGGGSAVEYPAAVAPKRSKRRKGRTNRRRSITLPSPPSVARGDQPSVAAFGGNEGDMVTPSGEGEGIKENENDKHKSESEDRKSENQGKIEEQEGDSEEEDADADAGDDHREDEVANEAAKSVPELRAKESEPSLGDEGRGGSVPELRPPPVVDNISSDSQDRSSSESDHHEDTELEERLRKTQERLRMLQLELTKVQANVANVMHGEGSEPSGDAKKEEDYSNRLMKGEEGREREETKGREEPEKNENGEEEREKEPLKSESGGEVRSEEKETNRNEIAAEADKAEEKVDVVTPRGTSVAPPPERKAAGPVKARSKKPKRIVSILDAGVDENEYYSDKLNLVDGVASSSSSSVVEDDVARPRLSSTDEREEALFALLQSVEDFSHQILAHENDNEHEAPPSHGNHDENTSSLSPLSPASTQIHRTSPLEERGRSPPAANGLNSFDSLPALESLESGKIKSSDEWAQPSPSATSTSSLSSSSSTSSSSSSLPPSKSAAAGPGFNKAALSSLLSLGSVTSDAIEHHHEFYPESAMASLASRGSSSGYYSPSYIASSPLSQRMSPSSSSPSSSSSSSSPSSASHLSRSSTTKAATLSNENGRRKLKQTVRGNASDSDGDEAVRQRERSEADFRALQENDASGFLLTVPTKLPASKANTKCPSCGVSLADGLLGGIRYCHYTGMYYCPRCHQNEKALIPARIVHDWDMKEHKVSSWAKEYIEANLNRPTLNIATINPQLYVVPALAQVLELRKPLAVIGEFVQTCKDRPRLTAMLWQVQREYLIESTHRYAIRDLVDIHKNKFVPFLQKVIEEFVTHITSVCAVCKGKAHFCELCRDENNLVFPFQLHRIARCDECKSYFHKESQSQSQFHKRRAKYVVEGREPCPKCERVRAMKERLQREARREQELNLKESYGLSSLPAYPAWKGSGGASAAAAAAAAAGGSRGLAASAAPQLQQQQTQAQTGGRKQLMTSGQLRQLTYVTSQEARRGAGGGGGGGGGGGVGSRMLAASDPRGLAKGGEGRKWT